MLRANREESEAFGKKVTVVQVVNTLQMTGCVCFRWSLSTDEAWVYLRGRINSQKSKTVGTWKSPYLQGKNVMFLRSLVFLGAEHSVTLCSEKR